MQGMKNSSTYQFTVMAKTECILKWHQNKFDLITATQMLRSEYFSPGGLSTESGACDLAEFRSTSQV